MNINLQTVILVQPTRMEWKVPIRSVVDESCNISCSATGYPSPFVHAVIQPHQNCSYIYANHYVKVDNYTGKALITISRVSMNCLRVYCYSDHIEEMHTLNVTSK